MKLKRLLIVPGDRLAQPAKSKVSKLLPYSIQKKFKLNPIQHEGELQYIGEIPSLMGPENVFWYSSPLDERLSDPPEANCPYPSCHGIKTDNQTIVNNKNIDEAIKNVDAVILSAAAGDRLRKTIKLARKHDLPIAIIDRLDHENLFGHPNPRSIMFRSLSHGQDFDVYFKQDLLPETLTDYTFPLSPLPIRPSSYNYNEKSKIYSIFYSGRPRPDKCQRDREQMIKLVKDNWKDAHLVLHDSKSSFISSRDYLDNLSRTKLALSPSGRVWDSYRHCEIALAPNTALIAPLPYTVTCQPPLVDGINAILYKVKLNQHKFELDDPDIADKIQYYLNHQVERVKIAARWKQEVLEHHTVSSRSQYILKTISNII